jgi:hypothetical protein
VLVVAVVVEGSLEQAAVEVVEDSRAQAVAVAVAGSEAAALEQPRGWGTPVMR